MNKKQITNYPMVNPTPIVLVGANVEGRANYATIGAFGAVCHAPLFYISLKSTHYTTAGIKENGFFSINLPSVNMLQKTDYCGMVSGKMSDKSVLFDSFYDERGKAPMISESPMNYLCKIKNQMEVEDFVVFFGEIVATFVNIDCLKDGKPDPAKIEPFILMGTAYYSFGEPIGKVFQEGKSLKIK